MRITYHGTRFTRPPVPVLQNIFISDLDKYNLQSGKIICVCIWNTIFNLDKYICRSWHQVYQATSTSSVNLNTNHFRSMPTSNFNPKTWLEISGPSEPELGCLQNLKTFFQVDLLAPRRPRPVAQCWARPDWQFDQEGQWLLRWAALNTKHCWNDLVSLIW